MRIFKNAWFEKFARKQRISDASLCEAVKRAGRGLIDADLGGGLIKQRIGRPGSGKSGGYRTLILFQVEHRAVFAFGFPKNDRANIDPNEEVILKKAAKVILGMSDEALDREIESGRFNEVMCDD